MAGGSPGFPGSTSPRRQRRPPLSAPLGAGPGLGRPSLQARRAVGTVGLVKDSKANQSPYKIPSKLGTEGSGSPAPTAHVHRPGRTPPPEASAVLRALRSPRAASGSGMVTVLRLPAFGILTRFHGSRPGRTVAISGGRGGARKGGAR